MRYYESSTTELKREITDELKKEIIAFLNTHGGTIYVGVNDDGSIYYNLNQKEKDIEQTKIINWLANDVFSPNPKDFITLEWNNDGVLEIHVAEGDSKPYYLTNEGCNPKGVFIRFESSKLMATSKEIKDMRLASNKIFYEDEYSNNQNLHFTYLDKKQKELGINISYHSLGFLRDDKWTNLAYLFSDELNIKAKLYLVDLKNNILRKKEWKGSILKQVDEIISYLENNAKDGYSLEALIEALKNSFIHRNWSIRGNIKVEWSPSKINFISPGGFYHLTEEEAITGKTSYRNPKLVKVFKQFGYSKQYKTGMSKIYSSCKEYNVEPVIIATSNLYILSIPKKKKQK